MMKRSKPSFSTKDAKAGDGRRANLGGHNPVVLGPKDLPQVTPVPACLQRILSYTSDKSFLKVRLMNGTDSVIRCMDDTKVQDVIDHVVEQLGTERKSQSNLYGLVAICETPKAVLWLNRDKVMGECHKELHTRQPAMDQWRFELKIRFFFRTVLDLLQTDRTAFFYLFEQVRNDLRERSLYEMLERDAAIELAGLEIRLVLRERVPKTPSKKVNNTNLEETEWRRLLSPALLQGRDPKLVYKSVQKALKNYFSWGEEDCVLKYLDIVSGIWRYFEESFDCQISGYLSSSKAARLTVGPTVGIACDCSTDRSPATVANFDQVSSVSVTKQEDGSSVKLCFSGDMSPVTVRCASTDQSEQLASLVDGYCFLVTNGKRRAWTPYNSSNKMENNFIDCSEGQKKTEIVEMPDYAILEENAENETALPIFNRSINCPVSCTCHKESDAKSPLFPLASTPDLLSNARSPKNVPSSCAPNVRSGSPLDKTYVNHSSMSMYNVDFSNEANRPSIVNKLTLEAIEQKLKIQKQQSEDDAEWLHQEEAKLILGENHATSPKKPNHCDSISNVSKISMFSIPEEVEPSNIPAELQTVKTDGKNDPLYNMTRLLVQRILDLQTAVQNHEVDSLVDLTKAVGNQLKVLLSTVQSETSSLFPQTRDETEMAQKTLSSDFGYLVDAMKFVLRYSPTNLAEEYRSKMLGLGNALAKDAKGLFDMVDVARRKSLLEDPSSSSTSSSSSSSVSSKLVSDVTSQLANASFA